MCLTCSDHRQNLHTSISGGLLARSEYLHFVKIPTRNIVTTMPPIETRAMDFRPTELTSHVPTIATTRDHAVKIILISS